MLGTIYIKTFTTEITSTRKMFTFPRSSWSLAV